MAIKNIELPAYPEVDWSDPAGALKELREYVVATATDAANWYWARAKWKKRMGMSLRFVAIVATGIGGLLPLLAVAMEEGNALSGWGYVALAFAGASITLDKFFGFSRSWIRFVTTGTALQSEMQKFHMAWARITSGLRGKDPKDYTGEELDLLFELIASALAKVRQIVEEETRVWTAEYATSLSDLEKRVEAEQKALKPGGINLTIVGGDKAADGVAVSVDGMVVQTVKGVRATVRNVYPGQHKIEASGKIATRKHTDSLIVQIPAGEIVPVTLTLKK